MATILLLACTTAGCGPSGTNGAAEETALLVRNGNKGMWANDKRWSLVEEGRIGSATSEGADMFANIVDLEIDPLGRIWVADAQLHQIRVFTPAGAHVRSIGKKGGGPSEFEAIAGMEWAPDGNLWVVDGENARYAVFDTTGALVTTYPRTAGVTTTPWSGGFDSEGRLYDTDAIPGKSGEIADALVRYDASIEPSDTFPIPSFEGEFLELVSNDGRSRSRVNVPFTGSLIWSIDSEGFVWTATTDQYRFVRQAFSGDTVRIVERASDPVRVTDAEMDKMLENYSWFVERGGKLDRSRIPRTKPPVSTFFFDADGSLWVLPTRAEGETPGFDVFDRSGRYLGKVPTEARLVAAPPPVVRGNRLAGIVRDEDGVQTVVVMQLQKS